MLPGVLALVVVAVVVLATLHRREARRSAHERAGVFDDVLGDVDDVRVRDEGGTHPTLHGTLDGHAIRLRVLVDSLTLRKLPVLWLEVVVHRPLRLEAPLNLLRRPLGTEFFSPDGAFDHELTPPPGCPRPVRLSTTDPQRAPDPAVLDPAAGLLREPHLKELGLGRRGARAVWLLAESEQASYRVGRRAVFGPARVDPADLRRVVASLVAVTDPLGAAERSWA